MKSLGLPSKISSCEVNVLRINKIVQQDTNLVLGSFKYYSNLAGNLLKKLLNPPDKFILNIVIQHQRDSFNLATVSRITILTILKNTEVTKAAAGLDNLSGHFLKDGAKVLADPICAIFHLPQENFLTHVK